MSLSPPPRGPLFFDDDDDDNDRWGWGSSRGRGTGSVSPPPLRASEREDEDARRPHDAVFFDDNDNDDNDRDAAARRPAKASRPPRPKIDDERLLGSNGLVKLKQDSKKLRFKGKGHEAEDLRKLMGFYQMWAHHMFPRSNFRDAVDKVQRECRRKRLKAYLSAWREEATEAVPSPADLGMKQDEPARVAAGHGGPGPRSTPAGLGGGGGGEGYDAMEAQGATRSLSRPPSGLAVDNDNEDDDMMRIHDALTDPVPAPVAATEAEGGPQGGEEADFDEDEEEMMRAHHLPT